MCLLKMFFWFLFISKLFRVAYDGSWEDQSRNQILGGPQKLFWNFRGVFLIKKISDFSDFLGHAVHTAKSRLTLRTFVDYLRTRGKSWDPIFSPTQIDPFFLIDRVTYFWVFDRIFRSKFLEKAAQISSTDENFPSWFRIRVVHQNYAGEHIHFCSNGSLFGHQQSRLLFFLTWKNQTTIFPMKFHHLWSASQLEKSPNVPPLDLFWFLFISKLFRVSLWWKLRRSI